MTTESISSPQLSKWQSFNIPCETVNGPRDAKFIDTRDQEYRDKELTEIKYDF